MKTSLILLAAFGIVLGVLAGVSFIAMIWLGAVYGYFGLLEPLGLVDSGIIAFITLLIVNLFSPTKVKIGAYTVGEDN